MDSIYFIFFHQQSVRTGRARRAESCVRPAAIKIFIKGWLALIVTVAGAAMTTAVARKSNRYTNSTK